MESNFFNVVEGRRSIRRYLAKPVSDDVIYKILELAHMAPAAGNLDNWHFVIVEDETKRLRLGVECNHQYWMSEAPVLIVVLSEDKRLTRVFGEKDGSLFAVQNTSVAIQNLLLAAHGFGLGACWTGSFYEPSVKEIVGCPDDWSVQAVITLGYPAEQPPKPRRRDVKDVISFELKGRKQH